MNKNLKNEEFDKKSSFKDHNLNISYLNNLNLNNIMIVCKLEHSIIEFTRKVACYLVDSKQCNVFVIFDILDLFNKKLKKRLDLIC